MFREPVQYSFGAKQYTIREWAAADAALKFLSDQHPVAIFSLKDGSYIQCLGNANRLTVEARELRLDRSFTHWVFGRGKLTAKLETIDGGSVGPVIVDETQVLVLDDARQIIRQYLEARTFPDDYRRLDVSVRFK